MTNAEGHPAYCGGTYVGVGFVGGDFNRWRARCINHGNRLVEGPRGGPFEYVEEEEEVLSDLDQEALIQAALYLTTHPGFVGPCEDDHCIEVRSKAREPIGR